MSLVAPRSSVATMESVQTFGRKKTAVAVAYCKKGRGLLKVNGCPIELMEPVELRYKVFEPILLLGKDRFSNIDIRIRCKGGGYTSQCYAIRQASSRPQRRQISPLSRERRSLQPLVGRGRVGTLGAFARWDRRPARGVRTCATASIAPLRAAAVHAAAERLLLSARLRSLAGGAVAGCARSLRPSTPLPSVTMWTLVAIPSPSSVELPPTPPALATPPALTAAPLHARRRRFPRPSSRTTRSTSTRPRSGRSRTSL